MGIDQSYTSTGVVVLNHDKEIIATRIISTAPADGDAFQRSWSIINEIQNLVKIYAPETIGLEGLAYAKFGDATRDLAGLQFGIVHRLRFVDDQHLVIVTPNELKKFGSGKGNADKKKMVDSLPKAVLKYFEAQGYKKTKGLYDITDAYWIARYVLEKTKVKPAPTETKVVIPPRTESSEKVDLTR